MQARDIPDASKIPIAIIVISTIALLITLRCLWEMHKIDREIRANPDEEMGGAGSGHQGITTSSRLSVAREDTDTASFATLYRQSLVVDTAKKWTHLCNKVKGFFARSSSQSRHRRSPTNASIDLPIMKQKAYQELIAPSASHRAPNLPERSAATRSNKAENEPRGGKQVYDGVEVVDTDLQKPAPATTIA